MNEDDWGRNVDIEDALREIYPLLADTYVDVHSIMTSPRYLSNSTSFIAHGIREIMRGLVDEILIDEPRGEEGIGLDGQRFAEMIRDLPSDEQPNVPTEAAPSFQKDDRQRDASMGKEEKDSFRKRSIRMHMRTLSEVDAETTNCCGTAWANLYNKQVMPAVHIKCSNQSTETPSFDQICQWVTSLHRMIERMQLKEYATASLRRNLEKTDELLKRANP